MRMAVSFPYIGRLFALVLVASQFESSESFAPIAPAPVLQGMRGAHTLCLFRKPAAPHSESSASKTKKLIPVTDVGQDPKPYGQRLYPVHPDDLTTADRRVGLFKMILAVGVRDVLMGMLMAFVIFAVGAGFDSPDYHFPYAVWLFSCIFGRLVTQDDVAPLPNLQRASSMQSSTAGAPSLQRSASFEQWRASAIGAPLHPRTGAAVATQRLVANFAASEPAIEQSPSPNAVGLLFTIVVAFVSDLAESVQWMASPKSNVPADEETWDPRDIDTPTEPGI